MRNKRLTQEQINDIVELHKIGLTNREISVKMSLRETTISARLKRLGLKSNYLNKIELYKDRIIALHNNGACVNKISEILNISCQIIIACLETLNICRNEPKSGGSKNIDPNVIKQLHQEKKANYEIGEMLNITASSVGYHLKKLGLKPNKYAFTLNLISDTEAICSECKEIRNTNEFQFSRRGQKYEYQYSYCNLCRLKRIRGKINNDVDRYLGIKYNALVKKAKRQNIICAITKEEYIRQFYAQKGLCFYTDAELVCELGKGIQRNTMSVDKIIPEKGYVFGNIVFATYRINTCKNDLLLNEIQKWMPEWYNRIMSFINEEVIKQ